MMDCTEPLFSPVKVGRLSLPCRIVMAPMTRARSGPNGVPSELNALYYAQRASAGLIVAEATQIHPDGQGYLRTPGIHDQAQIAGWHRVTDAVHQAGGTIVLQLWHVGRVAHPLNQVAGARQVAPSALVAQVRIYTREGMLSPPVPHALEESEIRGVVAQYAQAAENALKAGFDGVEIHAGNGYLIDQFLQSGSNHRTDGYGGCIANRCRLLLEVTEAVVARIGADRVGVRLSPFGTFNDVSDLDPAALFGAVISALDTLGLAYLHVINLEVSGDRTIVKVGINVAKFSRQHYRGTLMAAGGYLRTSAEAALSAGHADLISFARPYIANPDLPRRLRDGTPLAQAHPPTFYTSGSVGYTDYPSAA